MFLETDKMSNFGQMLYLCCYKLCFPLTSFVIVQNKDAGTPHASATDFTGVKRSAISYLQPTRTHSYVSRVSIELTFMFFLAAFQLLPVSRLTVEHPVLEPNDLVDSSKLLNTDSKSSMLHGIVIHTSNAYFSLAKRP